MFDARSYILNSVNNPRPASVDTWVMRAEKLFNVLENNLGRQLSDEEKKTFTWLATGEPDVIEMLQNILEEIADHNKGGIQYPLLEQVADKGTVISEKEEYSCEDAVKDKGITYRLLEETADKGDIIE